MEDQHPPGMKQHEMEPAGEPGRDGTMAQDLRQEHRERSERAPVPRWDTQTATFTTDTCVL